MYTQPLPWNKANRLFVALPPKGGQAGSTRGLWSAPVPYYFYAYYKSLNHWIAFALLVRPAPLIGAASTNVDLPRLHPLPPPTLHYIIQHERLYTKDHTKDHTAATRGRPTPYRERPSSRACTWTKEKSFPLGSADHEQDYQPYTRSIHPLLKVIKW